MGRLDLQSLGLHCVRHFGRQGQGDRFTVLIHHVIFVTLTFHKDGDKVPAGKRVGMVKVWRGSNVAVETPVYAAEAVGRGSTMRRAVDGVAELAIGLFRAGAEKL